MDDFDYSFQISDRDWNTFYQECEECDLLTPVLASLDDSDISDADDDSPSGSSRDPHIAKETDLLELDLPDEGPPDCTGCPVEHYLSTCDRLSPTDVLLCSEEDTHLESMNKFFDRLKGISEGGSFPVKAKPEETRQGEVCAIEENSKDPQANSQDSNQMLTGQDTKKVGGRFSSGKGEKYLKRDSVEIESEDEAFEPVESTGELVIREEEWTVEVANEERNQEKEGGPSKNKLVKSASLYSSSGNDGCGQSNKPEDELECLELGANEATELGMGEGQKTIQAYLTVASSRCGSRIELQSNPEALFSMGTAVGTEHCTVESPKKKQKEHWSVSMGVDQDSSRDRVSPLERKNKKQIGCRRDSPGADLGFEGISTGTESEAQMERYDQEAVSQEEVLSEHDSTAYVEERGITHNSFSKNQMSHSSERFPTRSELLSEVPNVRESAAGSATAENKNGFKESVTVTRLEGSDRENILKYQQDKDLPNQYTCGLNDHLQNHSQQNCIPANNAATYNLLSCEQPNNTPENVQSSGSMIDPTSPQCTGLSAPQTRNGSERSRPKKSDRLNIPKISFPDHKPLKNEQTLQMNSQDKAVCQISKVSLKLSSSLESQLCDKSFVNDIINGSEDPKRQNLPLTSSQERNKYDTRIPEVLPPRESFLEKPNPAKSPELAEPFLSLNNISPYGPSWCKTLDPVDVTATKIKEGSLPHEEVENSENVLMNIPYDDTSHQCHTKTEDSHIRNIASKTGSDSEFSQASTITNCKSLLFEVPEMTDKQNTLVESDLASTAAATDQNAISLPSNSIQSSVVTNANGSSKIKSSSLFGSDSNRDYQADDWLLTKGDNLSQTSRVKSLQAAMNISTENNVQVVSEQELQVNSPVDAPLLHTFEVKADSRAELSYPLESTASAKPLESKELNKALDPECPVHTMSSFWKEMEKLTIDDILGLRPVSNDQAPGGLSRLWDTALLDTTDTGDSGYSSHLEDSKPDRSSGDMSTIYDFEEDYPLSHNASVNSSPESHDTKTQSQRPFGSSSSRGVLWESEPDPISQGMDSNTHETLILYSGDAICSLSNSDKDQQGLRKMCKNISVQNLRALETEPRVNQVTNASLHTIATVEEEIDDFSSTFQWTEKNVNSVSLKSQSNVEITAGPSVSRDESIKSYGISFREIFEYLFCGREAEVGLADTACTGEPTDDGRSVPEMYDYFFSEFDTGNFFFPLIQGSGNKQCEPVPIFSCSQPFNRNLQFPEAYDYFFPDDSPVESENKGDTDPDQGLVRVVACINKGAGEPTGATAAPDMYEHFFAESNWRGNLFWRNPFSLRGTRFTGFNGPRDRPTSGVLVTPHQQGRSLHSTICTDSTVDSHGTVSPQTPLYCLENFRELEDQQKQYTDLQKAVTIPNAPLLSVKQADMCLICIAVASWVLKTANPQDVDTWKAALLANVSALSAIRYLRRHVTEETVRNEQ